MKNLWSEGIEYETFDGMLDLFMVLFLKSDEAVKVTLMIDLKNIFQILKMNEIKIFVEKTFAYKIIFYQISQFKHCLKQNDLKAQ